MNADTADLALIADLTDAETDLFRLAAQSLLSRSFIIRGVEKDDSLWDFSVRNIRLLEAWFACAGLVLKRDEGLGVISLRPGAGMRIRLGKEETCALLVLRLLFEEKRTELSLSRFPSVRVFDFLQRYRAVTALDLKKTRLVEIIRAFVRNRLAEIDGDPADPESVILLLPSIAMSLDQAGMEEIIAGLGTEGSGNGTGDDDTVSNDESGEEA